jgi:hypothetical protein
MIYSSALSQNPNTRGGRLECPQGEVNLLRLAKPSIVSVDRLQPIDGLKLLA